MTEQLHFHVSLSCTGEGNGNPLQCSCLGNPTVGGAWWAAIYGVTQSRTQLKRLSSSSSSSMGRQVQSLGWEDLLQEDMTTHSKHSCLENLQRQRSLVCYSGVTKIWTQLSDQAQSQLTMLGQFQVDRKGTQSYIYMYPFSPKLPTHLGCHITLSRVPCALQQVLVCYPF